MRSIPQASRDFLDLLEKAEADIQGAPQRWPLEEVLRCNDGKWLDSPYIVFYSNDLHEIHIVAIAHTSRRPGYWKTRIAVD